MDTEHDALDTGLYPQKNADWGIFVKSQGHISRLYSNSCFSNSTNFIFNSWGYTDIFVSLATFIALTHLK